MVWAQEDKTMGSGGRHKIGLTFQRSNGSRKFLSTCKKAMTRLPLATCGLEASSHVGLLFSPRHPAPTVVCTQHCPLSGLTFDSRSHLESAVSKISFAG